MFEKISQLITGPNRYVYDFSVDYNIIGTSNIIDTSKHFMK